MTASTDIRNVALIGHKASGKTSLAEALLYIAKANAKLGKVDDKTSTLDETAEEKEHSATFEASIAHLLWNGKKVNLVDTPGEGSFLADTRLALGAVDAAILCVSAKDGVQPITERVFAWAKELNLPCIVVVTKVDAENASPEDAVAEVRSRLKAATVVMERCVGEGHAHQGVITLRTRKAWLGKGDVPGNVKPGLVPSAIAKDVDFERSKLVDDIAGTDDALTERYLTEGDLTQEELDSGLRAALRKGALVPVYFASGTHPSGITALLDAIVELVPPPTDHAPFHGVVPGKGVELDRKPDVSEHFAAYVFKTSIDQHAGKASFARILSGSVKPDSAAYNASIGEAERIGKLHLITGKDHKALDEAIAGDIVAFSKLKVTRSGDTICDERHVFRYDAPEVPMALFSRGVRFDGKAEEKVATALHRLVEEDPGLSVTVDATTRELVVSGLGALHLEITVERIRRRIGIDCRLGPPHIAYKETITKAVTNVEGKHKKQSGGHGQFGVCFLDVEPMPRGSGFTFEDAIVGGSIPRQFIPSVEKGVAKAMARGFLAGFPIVDVNVRVVDGKYHDVDSSDAAFQLAGSKGFKAALASAGAVLLEPVVKLHVVVPSGAIGDVIGDINARRGHVIGTDAIEDQAIVNAFVPLAEVLEYESKLKGLTHGKGTFSMTVDHLEVCPPNVQDKVIKDSGFKSVDDDE
jgi:elongation factor G